MILALKMFYLVFAMYVVMYYDTIGKNFTLQNFVGDVEY